MRVLGVCVGGGGVSSVCVGGGVSNVCVCVCVCVCAHTIASVSGSLSISGQVIRVKQ